MIRRWKENILEIKSGKENIFDSELEGKYFSKSRMRMKTLCDEKLEGKYFGNPSEKEDIL